MNILYISSKKRWGGVSSWMSITAQAFERRGHAVYILAHPKGRFAAAAPKNLRVVRKKLGMDYNPLMTCFLSRFIKRRRIKLLVTNIEKEVIAGGIAARICGIPNVRRVGREDDLIGNFKVRCHHQLFVDSCIVPCNVIRDNALKAAKWLDASQFVTIYNGRNHTAFTADQIARQRLQWGLPDKALVFGVTTQLTAIKKVDGLIRAFSRLLRQASECRLVITGEGSERPSLEALAGDLELSDKVVFAGYSSNPLQTAAAYDIAVSNSSLEGFPNSVVEYFATGRPVISTDVGGVSEMVRHMDNGLLVAIDDEQGLYESMRMLVESESLRAALGEGARRTIREKFSEDIMVDHLESFFRGAIGRYGYPSHSN